MTVFSVKISVAELADAEVIADLSRQTFFETFANKNTKENMDKYLDEKFNLAVVRSELEDAKTIFFLASINAEPIGYSKSKQNLPAGQAGKLSDSADDDKALEIERIYVYKEHQSKKIGAILMR